MQNNLFSNYMLPSVTNAPSPTERRKTANSSAAPSTSGPRVIEPSPRKSLQATQPSQPPRVGLAVSPSAAAQIDDPLSLAPQPNRRGPQRLAHAQPQSQTSNNAAADSSGVDWE